MSDVKQFTSDKILKHIRRVCNWIEGENVPPITVELDMTNICNHKCPECVVSYYQCKDNITMDEKFAESIVDQLANFGIKGVIFTGGGEPLCCSYTPNVIAKARKNGLDVGLITNGSFLSEKNIDTLVENCTWIRVSLDAGSTQVYKKTHGMSADEFCKVLKNIKLLVKRRNIIKSKCTIGVGYLTSKDTCSEPLRYVTRNWKDLGVDYIQFRPMQIHRGGDFEYNWYDVIDRIEDCVIEYNSDKFNVLYSKHKYDMMKREDFGRDYKICFGHQFATTICADGKVYICCHLRGYEKYCIGDLTKNTFEEIWNSKYRKTVYNRINFKDCIPLCRCNTFNQILWNLKQKREHVNFL